MENIIVKVARRVKALMYVDHSVAEQPKSAHTSKTRKDREANISQNKAMFSEIFGEEAPSWWGDFSIVKH